MSKITKQELHSSVIEQLNKIDALESHKKDLISTNVNKGASLIGINDAGSLFAAKTVEGALSELFTNVSNGKALVGTAIIDADNSIVVPTDPTFQQLANLITSFSGRRKIAEGTGTASPNIDRKRFNQGNGNPISLFYLQISGLSFKPSVVYIYGTQGTYSYGSIYRKGNNNLNITDLDVVVLSPNSVSNVSLLPDGYVNNNGFLLPTGDWSGPVKWIALE